MHKDICWSAIYNSEKIIWQPKCSMAEKWLSCRNDRTNVVTEGGEKRQGFSYNNNADR